MTLVKWMAKALIIQQDKTSYQSDIPKDTYFIKQTKLMPDFYKIPNSTCCKIIEFVNSEWSASSGILNLKAKDIDGYRVRFTAPKITSNLSKVEVYQKPKIFSPRNIIGHGYANISIYKGDNVLYNINLQINFKSWLNHPTMVIRYEILKTLIPSPPFKSELVNIYIGQLKGIIKELEIFVEEKYDFRK